MYGGNVMMKQGCWGKCGDEVCVFLFCSCNGIPYCVSLTF